MQTRNTLKATINRKTADIIKSLIILNIILFASLRILIESSSTQSYLQTLQHSILISLDKILIPTREISPRLKIFTFDDKTVSFLARPHLGASGWHYLCSVLNGRNPQAIIVDSIFSFTDQDKSSNKLTEFLSRNEVPLYYGAFASNDEIFGRRSILETPTSKAKNNNVEGYNYLYASEKLYKWNSSGIGHLMLDELQRIKPVIKFNQDTTSIAHLGLSQIKEIKFPAGGYITLDHKQIRLDNEARLAIPLWAIESLKKTAKSAAPLFLDNEMRQAILDDIKEEDILLILPAMFTGSTDFKDSAIGRIEGGYLLASLINSSLTGQWLSVYEFSPEVFYLIAAFAVALSLSLKLSIMIFILVLVIPIILTIWIYMFTSLYSLIFIPSYLAVFLIFLVSNKIILLRINNRITDKIINSLGGKLDEGLISSLNYRSSSPLYKPIYGEMTVIFIDIVGFSKACDQYESKVIFKNLKRIMERMESSILKHGGMVDKIMGDGVLAIFSPIITSDHDINFCERALSCAREIQLENSNEFKHTQSSDYLYFPIRIGINTGQAHFGDLGGENRLELSCIGASVNFAARLEAAAEPFLILFGEDTFDKLSDTFKAKHKIYKKFLQIKHYHEYFPCYEMDVFDDHCSSYVKLMTAYKPELFEYHKEGKNLNEDLSRAFIITSKSKFEVRMIHVSKSRIILTLNVGFARNCNLKLTFASKLSELFKFIQISVENCYKADSAFFMSCSLAQLSEKQIELLVDLLTGKLDPSIAATELPNKSDF